MPRLSIEPNDAITYKVHYQDEHVVVVGKPAGLVTTPGLGHERDSLLNALFARWGHDLQNLGKSRDFGLLHRLDRDTSGLVVAALTARAYDALREAFERRDVRKFYWAVTAHTPKRASGVVRLSIAEVQGKVPGDARPKKLARVSPNGKPALTAYRVLAASPHAAMVECRPVTGRLHQVRVHLAAIRCPILGDAFYATGAVADAAPRLALHAHRLAFTHPMTGYPIDVRTRWPGDLRALLKRVGLSRPDLEPEGPSGRKGGEELDGGTIGDEDA
ncbi:MAG: hypothetical protein HBSAPP03_03360 [Phycisphaerae bacterium]|nr:MAG: hypothetical protein HBSAPP03_03360 [Phycisphaerae bacterium]